MWEVVALQISYETPLEVIEDLKTQVKQYLLDNNREWGGGLQMDIDSITQQNAIKLAIAIEHKNNWSDWGGRVSTSVQTALAIGRSGRRRADQISAARFVSLCITVGSPNGVHEGASTDARHARGHLHPARPARLHGGNKP